MQNGAAALGLDFGTTNSVAALGTDGVAPELVSFAGPHAAGEVFRTALCFWRDEMQGGAVQVEAGPWAIAEYLAYPHDSRFLQSFKSVAASRLFEHAPVFAQRLAFEDLGRLFLERLVAHSNGRLASLPERIVVGRPVEYAGARPDPALARERYDRMFSGFGTELHYVYEPLGAAFSYAAQLTRPATILVADFGGGTSDFSVVRVDPSSARRCTPLGTAGIGIAGDRFDYRIVEHLVLPRLGKDGTYRSLGKLLEIPRAYFADFADWSRLALMRNRKTLDELARLRKTATDPDAIGRMIAVIENELGFPLYEAVGTLKRALSSEESADFRFAGGGLEIEAAVSRAQFEAWIAPDLARIEDTIERALDKAGVAAGEIDRVFLTGGSSLIPAIRRIFTGRFGAESIAGGNELTSIAYGLALIGQQDDVAEWAA